MRNRRVRLLLLAVFITISFFLYSRSDPATIDHAKQYAQRTYQQALDQTIGKQKDSKTPTLQSDSVNAALDAKKDEPFRVDFGAYSKAAGLLPEETTGAAVPPPAAAAPVPEAKEPKPAVVAPVEPKKEDPMRVDFEHYSKAAQVGVDTSPAQPGADPLNNPVIANPNPIVGVVGAKDDTKPAKAVVTAKPEEARSSKQKAGLVQQGGKQAVDEDLFIGEGRMEIDVAASMTAEPVHWTKLDEKYPITSTIPYPYNDGKKIPKIQHDFKRDPASKGADKEKLDEIKAAALHSWKGYRDQAMGHDEVRPVSGKYANPFNAWGATLVDALDTLWLMGMREEFEDALTYVQKIDFTTSRRGDIPLFETTIRYLGGLLGAYELSGRNYPVLFEKIKQLGEVLYGAFDTPNRMPMTYYKWKPSSADKPHRASRKTIMAELGSLSLEFTRLGQIVAQPKYYDAIARITDALAEWQDKTRIPGLWPTTLDASGCVRSAGDDDFEEGKVGVPVPAIAEPKSTKNDAPKAAPQAKSDTTSNAGSILDTGITAGSPSSKEPSLGKIAGFGDPIGEGSLDSKDTLLNKGAAAVKNIVRRAVDSIGFSKEDVADMAPVAVDSTARSKKLEKEEPLGSSALSGTEKDTIRKPSEKASSAKCIPQGLASTDEKASDIYTLGAASDSTYEYLPKMYLLLGGRADEYRKMYIKAADASIKNLIYRPMIPDETREILFAGNMDLKPKASDPSIIDKEFSAMATHLTCFVGGMFGMAGKIFDRPQDLEMAKKLTDGCIWAYNVTTTGIMPEILGLAKCDSIDKCKWDKTAYYKALDPFSEQRLAPPADISKPRDRTAGKGALQKRQYGGGEMQYGAQTAPAVLPAAAVTIAAEVPPLGMGAAGMPNMPPPDEPAIKMPYDAGAAKKLPGVEDVEQADLKPFNKQAPDATKPDFVLETKAAGAAVKDKSPVGLEKDLTDLSAKPKVDKYDKVDLVDEAEKVSGDIPALPPLTHDEFVKKKIEDERLPLGVVGMYDRKYELRPEAIESVFYMYRITGEQYWRDRGWEMWNAVYKHTHAKYGASAIDDVSKETPSPKDTEESFWLAETLKYFYLLFDDPDRVSLDDWVLNTEAHFLTRLGA